ncbi:MAG: TetR/AcrR family transcriptional regulator [Candidatus Acetothermia bacterium]|nr:TetR/AcrR family transcriptional regulator [Candidatus Acetothermia bacterium]
MIARGRETGGRLPRTARGLETMARLLRGAEEVFRERGYEDASVSAICRRVGVAQGTFYLYFASKEEAYVRLVKELQSRLLAHLRRAGGGGDPGDRLLRAYDALLNGVVENAGLVQVFREAEFVSPEIPMRLYATLCEELAQAVRAGVVAGSFREVDPEVVAYGILGAVLFLSLRFAIWGKGKVPAGARRVGADFIRLGIADRRTPLLPGPPGEEIPAGERGSGPAAEVEGGEATRQALLHAAERAFGQAGFHRTTVSTITYLAGVGQGTFYLHFPSKVAIFNELVREISREFRRRQSLAAAPYSDRRMAEVEGLRSFFHWVRDHPGAYRIVREAEFVDEGVGQWYYTRLAQGYVRGLSAAMDRGEIRRCDPEALAYLLLGVAHLSGQRWVLWEGARRPPEEALRSLGEFILWGVERPA